MRRRDLLALTALPLAVSLAPPASARQAAPAGEFEHVADIPYGDTVLYGTPLPLLLDVYRPEPAGEPRPTVLLFHGGGFQIGDRTLLAPHAEALAAAGFVAVNIEYTLATPDDPKNLWPIMLDDAQRAVRWVRKHADEYGIDPDRICSYGHSAGGTLAALLGVRDTRDDSDPELEGLSSRTNRVVALAGVMDFTLPDMAAQYPLVMGDTIEATPAPYHDASAVEFVDDDAVPMLIVTGAEDTDVPVVHARALAAALEEADIEVELVEIPDAYHDHTNDWAIVGEHVLPFLDRQFQTES